MNHDDCSCNLMAAENALPATPLTASAMAVGVIPLLFLNTHLSQNSTSAVELITTTMLLLVQPLHHVATATIPLPIK
jgi:hypothetical protein